jgi:hypothetical protein
MSQQVEMHGWSAETEDAQGRIVGSAQLGEVEKDLWNLALAPEGENVRLVGTESQVLERAESIIRVRRPDTTLRPWRRF